MKKLICLVLPLLSLAAGAVCPEVGTNNFRSVVGNVPYPGSRLGPAGTAYVVAELLIRSCEKDAGGVPLETAARTQCYERFRANGAPEGGDPATDLDLRIRTYSDDQCTSVSNETTVERIGVHYFNGASINRSAGLEISTDGRLTVQVSGADGAAHSETQNYQFSYRPNNLPASVNSGCLSNRGWLSSGYERIIGIHERGVDHSLKVCSLNYLERSFRRMRPDTNDRGILSYFETDPKRPIPLDGAPRQPRQALNGETAGVGIRTLEPKMAYSFDQGPRMTSEVPLQVCSVAAADVNMDIFSQTAANPCYLTAEETEQIYDHYNAPRAVTCSPLVPQTGGQWPTINLSADQAQHTRGRIELNSRCPQNVQAFDYAPAVANGYLMTRVEQVAVNCRYETYRDRAPEYVCKDFGGNVHPRSDVRCLDLIVEIASVGGGADFQQMGNECRQASPDCAQAGPTTSIYGYVLRPTHSGVLYACSPVSEAQSVGVGDGGGVSGAERNLENAVQPNPVDGGPAAIQLE